MDKLDECRRTLDEHRKYAREHRRQPKPLFEIVTSTPELMEDFGPLFAPRHLPEREDVLNGRHWALMSGDDVFHLNWAWNEKLLPPLSVKSSDSEVNTIHCEGIISYDELYMGPHMSRHNILPDTEHYLGRTSLRPWDIAKTCRASRRKLMV
jgi:hypothetical protein